MVVEPLGYAELEAGRRLAEEAEAEARPLAAVQVVVDGEQLQKGDNFDRQSAGSPFGFPTSFVEAALWADWPSAADWLFGRSDLQGERVNLHWQSSWMDQRQLPTHDFAWLQMAAAHALLGLALGFARQAADELEVEAHQQPVRLDRAIADQDVVAAAVAEAAVGVAAEAEVDIHVQGVPERALALLSVAAAHWAD